MAVAFRSIGAVGTNTGTCTKAAGVVAGDLLLIPWENDAASITATLTGWTNVPLTPNNYNGAAHSFGMLGRIADGTEASTFTLSGLNAGQYRECVSVCLTGNDATSVAAALNITGHVENTSTLASITTTIANALLFAVFSWDGGSVNATAPTGWTRRLNGTSGFNMYAAEIAQATAGASGTSNWSATGTGGVAGIVVAVVPPSSGFVSSIAATLGAVGAAIAAQHGVNATIARTLAAVSPAISATHIAPVTATIAQTLAAATVAIAVSHVPPGAAATIAATLAPVVAGITAAHGVNATVASTLAPATVAISASHTPPGFVATIGVTLAPVGAVIAAQHAVGATISRTLAPVGATISVTHVPPAVTSTIAQTLAPVAPSITVGHGVRTSIASTLAAMTVNVQARQSTIDTPGNVTLTLIEPGVSMRFAGPNVDLTVSGGFGPSLTLTRNG